MNFFKLYIGDYQRDTAHLSVTEHGAYLLMLQHYYATEKPLPTGKALHRMLRAQDKTEREAIDSVVSQFWTEEDGGLVNLRAREELDKADESEESEEKRRENERARQKRAREIRSALYDRLRLLGVTPPFNATTAQLRAALDGTVTRDVTPNVTRDVTQKVTLNVTRDNTANQTPDTRQDQKKVTYGDSSPALPLDDPPADPERADPGQAPCPHEAIIALFHEKLPTLPRIREWTPARAALLRSRWRERPERQVLAWWAEFFEYVGKSDFLSGRSSRGQAHPTWECSLPWLLKAENFAKVIEGHYENRSAA